MRHFMRRSKSVCGIASFAIFLALSYVGLAQQAPTPAPDSATVSSACPQTDQVERNACLIQQLKQQNDRLEQLVNKTSALNNQLNQSTSAAKTAEDKAQEVQNSANQSLGKAGIAQQSASAAQQGATSAQDDVAAIEAKAQDTLKRAQQAVPVPAGAQSDRDDHKPLLQNYIPCLQTAGKLWFLRTGLPLSGQDPAQPVIKAISDSSSLYENEVSGAAANRLSSNLSNMNLSGASKEQFQQSINTAVTAAVQGVPATSRSVVKEQLTSATAPAVAQAAAGLPDEGGFSRPTDIGCSMSIMPWTEAWKVFGREVADEYLAIQVDVRNMDPDHDFLLHDAEFGVDAYGAGLERFQVGHEKQIVRGVSVWGQNYGRHANGIHIVEGVGIIMGAVVGLPQPSIQNLTNATGAYQAGFVPFVNKLFPNLSTNNLNNLNDFAFSATANSRIVVPKGGSVPFVLFVPIEPLLQACWLQKGYDFSSDKDFSTVCEKVCTDNNCKQGSPNWLTRRSEYTNLVTIQYKHWTPIQLQALKRHSFVAVAGAHFLELGGATTLKSINCGPIDQSGAIDVASLGSNSLTCTLSGAGFDSMKTLRMRPPGDTSDANKIDASVTASSDGTSATATVAAADVKKIVKPLYNLFSVDSAGKETDLKQSLAFLPAPTLTPIASPPTLTDFNKTPTLSLTGTNLQQVTQVVLKDLANNTVASANAIHPTSDGTSLTVTIGANDLAKLKDSVKYEIWFILSDANQTSYDSAQSITFGKSAS
jgi:hypothetical protein